MAATAFDDRTQPVLLAFTVSCFWQPSVAETMPAEKGTVVGSLSRNRIQKIGVFTANVPLLAEVSRRSGNFQRLKNWLAVKTARVISFQMRSGSAILYPMENAGQPHSALNAPDNADSSKAEVRANPETAPDRTTG